MAMKKIKPQYGKVIPPVIKEEDAGTESEVTDKIKSKHLLNKSSENFEAEAEFLEQENPISQVTDAPNPFLQTKEVFSQANLTKIGYRMRTEYVEILDIIKKLKKGGYTLEAVLDDALIKAKIFYS